MDYRGLGSVIGRKAKATDIRREEMMRKAAQAKRGQSIGGVIGGGLAAAGAGLATGGNPMAMMGAYSAGSEATQALMGNEDASLANAALQGGMTAAGYKSEMKAAEAAAKKEELLAAALKKLTA